MLERQLSVSQVCETLSVSRSGFYAWRSVGESKRSGRDAQLLPLISEVFWKHKRRYGARRIAYELAQAGERCGVARVARLLKRQGLKAIQPKSYRPRTTDSRHGLGYSPNLLRERAVPEGINLVWVGDITYVPVRELGFGYLSLLLDLCSRRIVGWEFSESMQDDLVLSALHRAISVRQPAAGLIHHSDRGGQYASGRYRSVLRRASMQARVRVFERPGKDPPSPDASENRSLGSPPSEGGLTGGSSIKGFRAKGSKVALGRPPPVPPSKRGRARATVGQLVRLRRIVLDIVPWYS